MLAVVSGVQWKIDSIYSRSDFTNVARFNTNYTSVLYIFGLLISNEMKWVSKLSWISNWNWNQMDNFTQNSRPYEHSWKTVQVSIAGPHPFRAIQPQSAEPIQSTWFGGVLSYCTLAISVRVDIQLQRRISFIHGASIKIIYSISNGLCLIVWFLSINGVHTFIAYAYDPRTTKIPAIISANNNSIDTFF